MSWHPRVIQGGRAPRPTVPKEQVAAEFRAALDKLIGDCLEQHPQFNTQDAAFALVSELMDVTIEGAVAVSRGRSGPITREHPWFVDGAHFGRTMADLFEKHRKKG